MITAQTLMSYEFFASLDKPFVEKIASLGKTIEIDQDEWLFKQDKDAENIYLLIEGKVALAIMFREHIIDTLNPYMKGEIIGWSALVRPHIYTMGAKAEVPSKLIAFNGKEMLELMDGNPARLFEVALELGKQIPLLSSDISKAQRGYRLCNPEGYQVREPEISFMDEATMELAFCQMLQRELMLWPQYLEAWQFTRDWKYVTAALESLRNIGGLYESFSDIIPADPEGDLDQLLTKLIRQLRDVDAWHRTASLMDGNGKAWQAEAQKRAEDRMLVLLQTVGLGQIALKIAHQLVSLSWRERWSEEHQARAQQPLNEGKYEEAP